MAQHQQQQQPQPHLSGTMTPEFYASHGITWRRRLQLEPLGLEDLPAHPDLAEAQKDAPTPQVFLQQLLTEIGAEWKRNFEQLGPNKNHVTADGTKYAFDVLKSKSAKKGEGPVWFQRTSHHVAGKPVTFEELDAIVRVDHEKHEKEYTPALYDVNSLLEWCVNVEGVDFEGLHTLGVNGADKIRVREVAMRVTQMHHILPGPLSDRVFSVLLVSFINATPPSTYCAESIDVQIPVDWIALPEKVRSRSHLSISDLSSSSPKLTYFNTSPNAEPTQKSRKGREVVEGIYVSIERISKAKGGTKDLEEGTTIWEMRTASDAKGVLPVWVQHTQMADKVCVDVPEGLAWAVRRRGGKT